MFHYHSLQRSQGKAPQEPLQSYMINFVMGWWINESFKLYGDYDMIEFQKWSLFYSACPIESLNWSMHRWEQVFQNNKTYHIFKSIYM